MTKYPKNNQPDSKINQNLLIAIIGGVTTIVAALIPWALNKYEARSLPTVTPLVYTATIASSESTPTFTVEPTVTPSIASSPTPTEYAQTGISDVYLAYDALGDFRSTNFLPTQNVYLFFNLDDPLKRNIVKIIWIAVDVDGYQPNIVLDKSENKITTSKFTMRTNIETWKPGKYKIELYLNGVLGETIEFEVAS